MREFKDRVESYGIRDCKAIKHGNSWSVYFNDPEDNLIEVYAETQWYVPQAFADELDLKNPISNFLRNPAVVRFAAAESTPLFVAHVVGPSNPVAGELTLQCVDGTNLSWLAAHSRHCIPVRPNRYVAARVPNERNRDMVEAYTTLLWPAIRYRATDRT